MSGLTLAQRLRVTAAVKGASFSISGDQARGLVIRLDQADAILPRLDQIEARQAALQARINRIEWRIRAVAWAVWFAVVFAGVWGLS